MGLTVCSGVMAEEIKEIGPINAGKTITSDSDVKIVNDGADSEKSTAAIRLDKNEKVIIKTSEESGGDIILQAAGSGIHTTKTGNSVALTADGNNQIYFNTINTTGNDQSGNYQPSGKDGNGITAKGEMNINLTAHGDNIIRGNNGDGINTESTAYGKIQLKAKNNIITVSDYGIYSRESSSETDPAPTQEYIAEGGNNQISGGDDGIRVAGNGILFLKAENGQNIIRGGDTATAAFSSDSDKNGSGIYLEKNSGGKVSLEAKANIVEGTEDGIYAESGAVDLTASSGENAVSGDDVGIENKGGAISLAGQDNLISGKDGILAEAGTVTLKAEQINYVSGGISAAKLSSDGVSPLGDGYAVHASGETAKVEASAEQNLFLGAVYADENASVQVGQMDEDGATWSSSTFNYVASSAVIGKSEALQENIVSALYAGKGADITLSGEGNSILSFVDSEKESDAAERTIWASKGGSIKIDGQTDVAASLAGKENTVSIALAAGTGDWDDSKLVDGKLPVLGENAARSTIQLNYASESRIAGDVVSGYGGKIIIAPHSSGESPETAERSAPDRLVFKGNALASNGGELTIDLGNNGYWEGRADSYKDADSSLKEEHTSIFAPEFSKGVLSSGTVNINMGDNSYWNVTGQSWVSSLSGSGIIDMRNHAVTEGTDSSESQDSSTHAVHIGKLSGEHTFIMDLNAKNHSISDMLYVYDTVDNGTQTVQFNSITGWENMEDGAKLRFATVNASETELTFSGESNSGMTYLRDLGIKDMAFTIENEEVTFGKDEADRENQSYNGESFGNNKPGNEFIENNYSQDNSQNWYLIKNSAGDVNSDAGKTVIDMSKVNYSNAVYMDRLNKRMGEARYIDGDDGLWVRLRHDRIGKEDAFRSMNTMMELGYDRKVQSQKDGEHRRGVAFDYMRGTADYTNVVGSGDVRRAGVWLYDTWLGDRGHYTDYVVKYGRLSNDFDIYARTSGNKISGDYDNDVWSASAEYGRKKDIGNEWYFEPQAQMQYAYVTSADYTTSQGTKVELDGIDSLIGRAGFRLGRDTSEGNTVYFKADILHEFLGDQSIRAVDKTGVLSTTYENEGTWYDVGFGFSHRMGKDSYMFLDLERSFGNDNTDTWQVNVGLNWKV